MPYVPPPLSPAAPWVEGQGDYLTTLHYIPTTTSDPASIEVTTLHCTPVKLSGDHAAAARQGSEAFQHIVLLLISFGNFQDNFFLFFPLSSSLYLSILLSYAHLLRTFSPSACPLEVLFGISFNGASDISGVFLFLMESA